jgi:hypothetical protein
VGPVLDAGEDGSEGAGVFGVLGEATRDSMAAHCVQ